MHWIVLFVCILIGLIIVFQLINIISRKSLDGKNRKGFKFLWLGVIFLLYNVLNGLLPNNTIGISTLVQYVLTYGISIIMCLYLVWYLYDVFDITYPIAFFKIKNLALILLISFLLFFIIPYKFSSSLNLSRSLFLILPTVLAILFLFYFFTELKKENKAENYFRNQKYLGLCSILSIILLPLLTFFGDFQPITQPLVSMAFFFVTAMEINSYLFNLKNQYLFNESNFEKYNFTNREKEIALQIIEKHSYKKIAENMFLSDGTVRKHASNIFIKSSVSSKKEFLNKFSN